MFGGGFSGRAPLTRSLVDMAGGSAIAGREATPTRTDDWSFTVQELIDFTGALPIRAQHHALGFPVAEADPVRAAANSSAAQRPGTRSVAETSGTARMMATTRWRMTNGRPVRSASSMSGSCTLNLVRRLRDEKAPVGLDDRD